MLYEITKAKNKYKVTKGKNLVYNGYVSFC